MTVALNELAAPYVNPFNICIGTFQCESSILISHNEGSTADSLIQVALLFYSAGFEGYISVGINSEITVNQKQVTGGYACVFIVGRYHKTVE